MKHSEKTKDITLQLRVPFSNSAQRMFIYRTDSPTLNVTVKLQWQYGPRFNSSGIEYVFEKMNFDKDKIRTTDKQEQIYFCSQASTDLEV